MSSVGDNTNADIEKIDESFISELAEQKETSDKISEYLDNFNKQEKKLRERIELLEDQVKAIKEKRDVINKKRKKTDEKHIKLKEQDEI